MVQTIFKGNHSLKTYDDVAILLLQFQDMNTELNEQVDLIPSDHGKKSCHEVDNPWSYYVFNNNTDLEESTTELNGDFIHSQLLINCLLKMELTPMAKKEFISFCQNQTDCKDNKEHATHVNEFEKNYSHNTALLCRDYKTAKCFACGPSNSEQIGVVFKIKADHQSPGIKPFADISSSSIIPSEEETLFLLGSIFRVDSEPREKNGIWKIKLTLCSDHDQDVKSIFDHLQNESSQCELNLLAFGNVLHDMGKFDQAKSYYDQCLDILPSNDDLGKAYCYYLLGLIATEKDDNKSALNWFEKSLNIRSCILQPSDPSIADTFNAMARVYYNEENYGRALKLYNAMCYTNLGLVCTAQQNYSDALKYHDEASQIRHKHLPKHHFRFGTSYHNKGEVHQHSGNYKVALKQYKRALKVYKTSLPLQHVDIAKTLVIHIFNQELSSERSFFEF
ncbi:unnamed protein product [Rotaria magnacalcarata]|uniref:Uncharacterized protein n=1 Tax=Rotaria magnacalcarata TaxID=392030 RepID=A0A8S2N2I6_9BILA|nr:unnamed protein product [Rotaria magnacalcarata]CAF3977105.1 unnamed protein product [Rotaria magnacalcarata]CAF4013206.1 unnamed protein product [Rotaria magnacalcarata]